MNCGKIAKNYLTGWFVVDLIAVFPTYAIERAGFAQLGEERTNNLIRLARLPRLYKLIRLLRIFKIIKVLKYNARFKRLFGRLNLDLGTSRVMRIMIFCIFIAHLFACFFFMSAKFNDFTPETWVYDKKLLDSSIHW